jgi:hypothetical protein
VAVTVTGDDIRHMYEYLHCMKGFASALLAQGTAANELYQGCGGTGALWPASAVDGIQEIDAIIDTRIGQLDAISGEIA